MNWEWLLKGALLGFSIAAPVGPISILCIKNTLRFGFKTGVFSGLGAATADAAYGIIAGCGLTAIMVALTDYTLILQASGGLFICLIGIKTLLKPAEEMTADSPGIKNAIRSFMVTLLLTLSNPMTIVFFIGVFTASGVAGSQSGLDIPLMVGGVFIGSAGWWIGLTGAIALLRRNMTQSWMKRLSLFNKMSGLVMLAFGLYGLYHSTYSLF